MVDDILGKKVSLTGKVTKQRNKLKTQNNLPNLSSGHTKQAGMASRNLANSSKNGHLTKLNKKRLKAHLTSVLNFNKHYQPTRHLYSDIQRSSTEVNRTSIVKVHHQIVPLPRFLLNMHIKICEPKPPPPPSRTRWHFRFIGGSQDS